MIVVNNSIFLPRSLVVDVRSQLDNILAQINLHANLGNY